MQNLYLCPNRKNLGTFLRDIHALNPLYLKGVQGGPLKGDWFDQNVRFPGTSIKNQKKWRQFPNVLSK